MKLLLLIVAVGLACSLSRSTDTPSAVSEPSTTPAASTATPISSVRIPDEGRLLFEAWRVLMQDFIENDTLDPRLLSDGAILGILDVTEGDQLSLPTARDLVYRLDNVGGFFTGDGGGELREAYEVWAYAFEQFVEVGSLPIAALNEGAVRGMVEALGDPYTAFLSADDLRLDQEDLKGCF
ncbi:MAG: hypothetical protein ACE5JL_13355, partial [Dehalococcoidia bacterium]